MVYPAKEGDSFTRVPLLPGCGSQGETIEEALKNTREAKPASPCLVLPFHICQLLSEVWP